MSSMDLGVLMSGLLWICCEMLFFLFSTSWLMDIPRHSTDTYQVHVVYITHCSKFEFFLPSIHNGIRYGKSSLAFYVFYFPNLDFSTCLLLIFFSPFDVACVDTCTMYDRCMKSTYL